MIINIKSNPCVYMACFNANDKAHFLTPFSKLLMK